MIDHQKHFKSPRAGMLSRALRGSDQHLHRESLREVSRCRHAALDRLLLRPIETFAGDPDHCRMMDDSPNDPGVANAWDSSDARGAYEDRPPRAA